MPDILTPPKSPTTSDLATILQKQREVRLTSTEAVPVEWKKYDPLYRSLMDFFGVDTKHFARYEGKIDFIREVVQEETGSKDKTDLLLALKDIEKKLTPPPLREQRINNVYKWLRLEKDRVSIEKELRLLEKEEEKVSEKKEDGH